LLSQAYPEYTSEMAIVKQHYWCHVLYDILVSFSVIACMGNGKMHHISGEQAGTQGKKGTPLFIGALVYCCQVVKEQKRDLIRSSYV
jgi:hypothetical protein